MPSVIPNGKAVRTKRSLKGLTQEELAEKSGYSKKTIERIENGNGTSIETLENIAEVLEVVVDVLLVSGNVVSDGKVIGTVSGISLEIIVNGDASEEARARVGAKIMQLLGEEVACINIRQGSVVLGYEATERQRQSIAFFFLGGQFESQRVVDVMFEEGNPPSEHLHVAFSSAASFLPSGAEQSAQPSRSFMRYLAGRRFVPYDDDDLYDALGRCVVRFCTRPFAGSIRKLFTSSMSDIYRQKYRLARAPVFTFSSLPDERALEEVEDPKFPPPPRIDFELLRNRMIEVFSSPPWIEPVAAFAGFQGPATYVMLMARLEGYSSQEIANAFSISVSAARTRIARGQKRLRDMLPDIEEFLY
ncbi:helix-turn-helix domain-containing protein [Roseiconus lacunae]|uniref:helix-turn-helix domain-containing protein n=1 Tax=Roseiconus lacunae TaxID=2605694 RepID=UPI001E595C05|nr:helix-turn-helix domain-containing protein [Roseiconus lacunae]MCD0463056.1 helix-turn-helix domain-containing protein [Roseiconus lacunae]